MPSPLAFSFFFFSDRFSHFSWGWLWTEILLLPPPELAGITGMHHNAQ
jgi:hypothetical protein